MTKRTFTWLFLLPLLLFLCYYNTGVVNAATTFKVEADSSQSKAESTSWPRAYYLLPEEEEFALQRLETKYPDRKFKLADKHRLNSGRYKSK